MLIPLWNLHTGHQCLGENPTRLYRRHRGVESVPVAFFVRRRRAGRVSLKGMFFSLSLWITFSTGSRRSAPRSFSTQKLKCLYHHIQTHMSLVIASGVLAWRKFSLNEDVLPLLQMGVECLCKSTKCGAVIPRGRFFVPFAIRDREREFGHCHTRLGVVHLRIASKIANQRQLCQKGLHSGSRETLPDFLHEQ